MVGTEDVLLPDRGPDAARQALAAARAVRVFDGRATVWLLLTRAIEVAGLALAASVALWGVGLGRVGSGWALALGFAIVLLAGQSPLSHLAGAEPQQWPTRWRVGLFLAAVALVLLSVWRGWPSTSLPVDPVVLVWVVVLTGYLLSPIVRWAGGRARARGAGLTPWPEGAEAYAVLSVLGCARWVHADRLAALAGMYPVRGDEWADACAKRGLVLTGRRRTLFARGTEITPLGRRVLGEWTRELEARASAAQSWTSSTAPTSPDVSSARSSSEVT